MQEVRSERRKHHDLEVVGLFGLCVCGQCVCLSFCHDVHILFGRQAITSVLSTDPRQCAEALESIRLAYQNLQVSSIEYRAQCGVTSLPPPPAISDLTCVSLLQGVDVFDTTKQGTEMWQIKLSSYREGIEEVEKSLEATLKALVGTHRGVHLPYST